MFKKRIFYALALLVAGSVFLGSCSKDDDDDIIMHIEPTISVTPATDTAFLSPGDTVKYQINISTLDELKFIEFTSEIAGTVLPVWDTTMIPGPSTFSYNLHMVVPPILPVGTVGKFVVSATTNFNKITTESRYFKVIPPATSMSNYQDVKLQAQADGVGSAGTNLSFYDVNADERYTYNEANNDEFAAVIDLVFTHHSVFKGTANNTEMKFQSPNEQNLVQMWQEMPAFPYDYSTDNKNQTYFKKLTTVDWDNLSYDAIATTVGDIGILSQVKDLNNGDYIGFLTEGGKYGIIKVTDTYVQHNPYNASTITFDVKVQD
ncbi:MAG TPA: hypothetical protein VFC92_03410 [Bacteroidales bacterium]|nr:hypothetical protein [Bacteroidales bacterium]